MRTVYIDTDTGTASPTNPTLANFADPYDDFPSFLTAEAAQTDDLTVYVRGSVDLSPLSTDTMNCASLLLIGDVNEPRWLATKATARGVNTEVFDHGGAFKLTAEALQIEIARTVGSTGAENAFASVARDADLHNCLIRATGSQQAGDGSTFLVRALGAAPTGVHLYNCILFDADRGEGGYGIRDNSGSEIVKAYNCIIYNCSTGARLSSTSSEIKNSAFGANVGGLGDYHGNWEADYNIANESGAVGVNGTQVADISSYFVDPGNGDFRLTAAGITAFQDQGLNDPSTGAFSDDISGATRSGTWDIGPSETANVLAIQTEPSSFVRGSAGSFVVSDPATAPTTLNTTVTIGGESLTVDSVTGANPYTINYTVPANIALQHANYVATITIDAENINSSSLALDPPAGWGYTNLTNPVTTTGSILESYAAKATPVTGDQVVYEATMSPSGDGHTVGATGAFTPDVAQSQNQTLDRYIIEAAGTVLATEQFTYIPNVFATVSISNSLPEVGEQVTINLSNASASGKTLSIPAGALTVDSQDASAIVFTVPDPGTFGNNQTPFLESVVITVVDGVLNDTISMQIQPLPGHDYAVLTEVSGIHATIANTLIANGNEPPVIGDSAEGYFVSGAGDVDLATGSINPTESSIYRIRYQDASDNNAWGAYGDVALEPNAADTTPDQFSLGADVLGAELNAETVRSFIVAGMDAGESVTATATGDGEVSIDGVNFAGTAQVQNGNTVYVRGNAAGAYATLVSVGVTISGVSDSFDITTRAANAPSITTQPQSQTVSDGANFSFTLVASNAVGYQWYDASNNSAIPGATASTYSGVAQIASDGLQVYCIATSSEGGTVQSATVTLTVTSTAGISFAALGAFTNGAAWSTPAEAGQVRGSETGITVILLNGSTLVSRTTNNTTDASGILNSIATPGVAINTTLLCIVRMPDGSSAVFEQNVGNIA